MEDADVESGKRRINFSRKTKEMLRVAAGNRCCFPTCLRLTHGISKKNSNKELIRGIGVAAHVYSAGERGPRGQNNMSVEQIKHQSNGLWMCANHAREVDDFQDRFSAEHLLRIKAVRELAHDLELHNDYIAFFVKEVSLKDWNECVWDSVSEVSVASICNFDKKIIVDAFVSMAIQKLALFDKYKHTLPLKLPPSFAIKPIASILSSLSIKQEILEADMSLISVRPQSVLLLRTYDVERKRAIDLAKNWRKKWGQDSKSYEYFVHEGEVWLSARDPATGIILDSGIWQNATIVSQLSYSLENGEVVTIDVKGTYDDVSAFDWRLEVDIKHGTYQVKSELRKRSLGKSYLRDPSNLSEFYMYRKLLQKIASGWEGIGYVSLLINKAGLNSPRHLYPEPFKIDCKLNTNDLTVLLRDCEKVATALEVARRLANYFGSVHSESVDFVFNDVFFMDFIDSDTVYYVYEELIKVINRNKNNPAEWKTIPVIMSNKRSGICFCYTQGALMFQRGSYLSLNRY